MVPASTSETVGLGLDGGAPVAVPRGVSVLDACELLGAPLESACGGFAACNSCRVQVEHGMEHLSPRLPEEEPFLDASDQRLGCQARVWGAAAVRRAPGA